MSSAHAPTCGKSSLTSRPLLPYLRERERRLQERAGLALGRDGPAGQRLAVKLVEHRLGVEGVHLRRAAVHEQEDDVLRPRRMVQAAARARLAWRAARGPRPRASRDTSPANASMPKPLPIRQSASRRVTGGRPRCISAHEDELVRAQEDLQVPAERGDRQHLLFSSLQPWRPGVTPDIMPSPGPCRRQAARPRPARVCLQPVRHWPSPARHRACLLAWPRCSSLFRRADLRAA